MQHTVTDLYKYEGFIIGFVHFRLLVAGGNLGFALVSAHRLPPAPAY